MGTRHTRNSHFCRGIALLATLRHPSCPLEPTCQICWSWVSVKKQPISIVSKKLFETAKQLVWKHTPLINVQLQEETIQSHVLQRCSLLSLKWSHQAVRNNTMLIVTLTNNKWIKTLPITHKRGTAPKQRYRMSRRPIPAVCNLWDRIPSIVERHLEETVSSRTFQDRLPTGTPFTAL